MGRIKNYLKRKKYPFWKMKNALTGKFMGYECTWYDEIPEGWRKTFGKQLSEEILSVGKSYLKEHKGQTWDDVIHWEQIKEKFGELRLHASAIDEIQDILTKYEYLSMCYCIDCGKPARFTTKGYLTYLCPECAENIPLEFLHRLTKDDIPHIEKAKDTVVKREMFLSERKCDEAIAKREKLDEEANPPRSYIYHKVRKEQTELGDNHPIWILERIKREFVEVDMLNEYGIDYLKSWGIGGDSKKNKK